MSAAEFTTSRAGYIAAFQQKYDELKSTYRTALDAAINEKDPATQTVRIKDALDANKKLTDHVQSLVDATSRETPTVTPEKLRTLRADIQMFKGQYAQIQQGSDKLKSLEAARSSIQDQIVVVKETGFWYLVALVIFTVIAVSAMVGSSIRSALNTQSVPSVFSSGFTQPRYF